MRESVAEIEFLKLGGVDQWVMIRGASLAKSTLDHAARRARLERKRGFFRCFNAPLEKKPSRSSTGISAAPASRSTAASLDRQ